MDLRPGEQLGTLSIEREIGRGAYGVVYLVRDTLLDRPAALKVLTSVTCEIPEAVREQVLTEARLIAGLNSPNVVTLYRLHTGPDGGWMQEMELVEGGSLEDRLTEGEPLELALALQVFGGVCAALKAAHEARILHGDIKPANVLFGADDLVKLADFGMARLLRGADPSVELQGQVFGTPHYMAPEVMTGQSSGLTSDLWSAVVLLYRMVSGRMPFEACDFTELFQKVMMEDPTPLGDEVPAPLVELIGRGLAKSVEDRPSNAAFFLDELDRLATLDVRLKARTLAPERTTNFTPSASSFVGRESDLDRIAHLITDENQRLITVAGPGGVGKTRLCQQLCIDLLDRFEGGCWFVDLVSSRDASEISHTVAQALGVPALSGNDPADVVAGILEYRPPMLMVLDNFEQVVEHATETVGLWIRRASNVTFLVTSREWLALEAEQHYELAPLRIPSQTELDALTPASAEEFPGVRLFVDRARATQLEFELDESNVADVVRICGELDGMPLALELAAARAAMMRPAQIAEKLNRKFQLLRSTRRDLSPRQKTLLGAIEWSYDLLEDYEKEAFGQAAYFRGGFTLDAAEEILDLDRFEDAPFAMDVLQGLRDKSLLRATHSRLETRLEMYRAIQEFGERRRRETGSEEDQQALASRHAGYFLDLAEQWSACIPGPRDQEAMDRIEAEFGNLVRGQEWALEQADPTTAGRITQAFSTTMRLRRPARRLIPHLETTLHALGDQEPELQVRLRSQLSAACRYAGLWDESLASAERAVVSARGQEAAAPLAEALLHQGEIKRNRGDLAGALECFTESRSIAQEASLRPVLARATGDRGMVLGQQGDTDEAFECFGEAVRIAREIGDHQTVALHVFNHGVVHEARGELTRAIECHKEAEEISRKIGDRTRVAVCLGARANVLLQSGDLDGALACYQEGEAIARELGAKQRIAQIVGNRGSAHLIAGDPETALECYREAESLARELGDRRRIATSLRQQGQMLEQMGETDKALECFEQAQEIGSEIGDRNIVARNICARGSLQAKGGRVDEAWGLLFEGISIYDAMGANRSAWYFIYKAQLASVASLRGNGDEARRLATEGLELASKLGLTDEHPEQGIRQSLQTLRDLV